MKGERVNQKTMNWMIREDARVGERVSTRIGMRVELDPEGEETARRGVVVVSTRTGNLHARSGQQSGERKETAQSSQRET